MSILLTENIQRNAILDAHYDPYLGVGSSIERQLFEVEEFNAKLYLPMSMVNIPWVQKLGELGSVRDFIVQEGRNYEPLAFKANPEEVLTSIFFNQRLDDDFEYWAATCAKIKPKKGGDFIPFILNYPQRLLWMEIHDMISKGMPINLILDKSRQFGGSTLIDNVMSHIQIRIKTNWNSLIAAHINQAAINVRSMLGNLIKQYPSAVDKLSLRPFEGTTNIKIIPERSNKITIGSMEKPDSIRSDDVKMAHLTEVGLWKKTQGKEPEDLCQSILGSLPMNEPYTMYALESTAKGVGNYFHRTWQQAVKGKNGLRPVFIPWLKDQKNRVSFSSTEEMERFIESFTNYDWFLWNSGATLEGINFYRMQLGLFNNDTWRMQSEFPTTAEESFQSTGNRYFPQDYVLALRKDCVDPIFKGEIVGDALIGKKSLENVRFEKNERGNLWVWEYPDKDNLYDHRYVVSMDIGGTTEVADLSIIRVIDRLPMLSGGDPKAIITWRGHCDQDILAFKGIQLSVMCDNALFVPEDNSLEKEEDGEHFQTILDSIKDYYRNIYIRNDVEKVGSDFVPKYGWHTNKKSKGLAIDALKTAARERMNKNKDKQDGYCYYEYDERVCSEMDCFEIKQTGKVGASDGSHDDMVMATAIGLYVAISIMPLPRLRKQTIERKEPRVRSHSSF